MEVTKFSYFPDEQEVLICPFFRYMVHNKTIKKVEFKNKDNEKKEMDEYQITLIELPY